MTSGAEEAEYEYDVALSFLAEDEGLATELHDLLDGRLRTFFYSKRQDIVAGTDGEATFNRVLFQNSAERESLR